MGGFARPHVGNASEEELVALDALREVFGDAAVLSMPPGWLYVRGLPRMLPGVAIRFARWQKALPSAVALLDSAEDYGTLVLRHARAPDGRRVLAGDPVPLDEPCCGYRVGSRDSDGTVCVACQRMLVPRTKRATP